MWQTFADLFNKLAQVDISSIETHAECPAEGSMILFFALWRMDIFQYHWVRNCMEESLLYLIVAVSVSVYVCSEMFIQLIFKSKNQICFFLQ